MRLKPGLVASFFRSNGLTNTIFRSLKTAIAILNGVAKSNVTSVQEKFKSILVSKHKNIENLLARLHETAHKN